MKLRPFCLSVWVALAAPLLSAAPALDKALSDEVDLFLDIPSLDRISAAWKQGAAWKVWQGADCAPHREWLAEVGQEMFAGEDAPPPKVREKWAELQALTGGRVALAVLDLEKIFDAFSGSAAGTGAPVADPGEDIRWAPLGLAAEAEEEEEDSPEEAGPSLDQLPSLVAALEFSGDADGFSRAVQALLAALVESAAAEEDGPVLSTGEAAVEGVSLRHLISKSGERSTTNFFWTVQDGYGLFGNRAERVAQVARDLAKGAAVKPLSAHPEYARAIARLDAAHLRLFLNLTRIMERVEKRLATQEAPLPMVGFSLAQLAKRLDLPAMLPMVSAVKVTEEGVRMIGDFGFSRETPLSKVLLPYGREKTELPGYIPADADSGTAMRLDLAKWYESLEVLFNSLSPQTGMFLGMARMGLTSQMGIDLKTDVLDHLGDTLVTAEQARAPAAQPPAAAPAAKAEDEEADEEEDLEDVLDMGNQLIGIAVKDPAAVQTTIGKVLAKLAPDGDLLEKKEYLGQTYFQTAEGGGPIADTQFAYALLDRHLVVSLGEVSFLHAAIRAHQQGDAAFWTQPAVRAALREARGAPVTVQLAHFRGLVEALRPILAMSGSEMPDPAPLAKLFGASVSVSYFDGNHLSTDALLRYPDAE
jgi:ribosomal protein L12E/L44/L45/RPP1/RPP2